MQFPVIRPRPVFQPPATPPAAHIDLPKTPPIYPPMGGRAPKTGKSA